ncbi:hypothetical protein J6590_108524 [Homalodisca vitripennis]|nr:hypothetical protein J6590_108524 [Homalodisca vitripennis]
MSERRKKIVVSMEEKFRAIQRMDAGESWITIAKELGVGKSTVGDWKKNRLVIEEWCKAQSSTSEIRQRKIMSKGTTEKVGDWLRCWKKRFGVQHLKVSGESYRFTKKV